jgi:hypothetical protein
LRCCQLCFCRQGALAIIEEGLTGNLKIEITQKFNVRYELTEKTGPICRIEKIFEQSSNNNKDTVDELLIHPSNSTGFLFVPLKTSIIVVLKAKDDGLYVSRRHIILIRPREDEYGRTSRR